MPAPKQGIQLKQTQTLSVTPQMQQSLRILQCNTQELEIEITRMLDENIMLERIDDDDFLLTDYDASDEDNSVDSLADDIPDIIDSDVEWENLYDDLEDYDKGNPSMAVDGFQEDWVADNDSFDTRLEISIHLSPLDDANKAIATALLSFLDEHYFLSASYDELCHNLKVDKTTLTRIIDVIKHLDPVGVACRNSQECMLAQLHNVPEFSEAVADAHDILSTYFAYIGEKNDLIKRRLALTDSAFKQAMDLIRSLSPYPKEINETPHIHHIHPDVFIHERMGMFYASLNKDKRYDIGINEEYAAMTPHCHGDEKRFMSAQLQTAKFFLRALDQRHKTILRVANAIVMEQQNYFIDGDKALNPLLLKDIAELLGLAESTISRAVNGKYLSFNQRLIELRHFFSSDLSAGKDNDINSDIPTSTKAIKARIKEIINEEPPRKPLSDTKIEKILQNQGIQIARRTIAKYREAMGILAASKRKRRN